jgi:polysaccharide biosynthesis protein PelC
MKTVAFKLIILLVAVSALSGCGGHGAGEVWRDQNMDFTSIQTVAVMPFANLSRDSLAGERVRDVFIPMLMETGSVYVLPPGEVYRALSRINIANPAAPSSEEVISLAANMKVNAVVTGVVREYGEVRSGSAEANVISLSVQMLDAQTGRVVWTASTTKGGITLKDRLLGGGGNPMNDVTEKAVNDLLDKLFK